MTPQQITAGLLIALFSLLGFFLVSAQGWADTLKQLGVVTVTLAVAMLIAKLFF